MASSNLSFSDLVGSEFAHVRGPKRTAVITLQNAILNDPSTEDYHEQIALAMANVARLWSLITSRPIPVFKKADELLERDGEAATISWN